MKKQLSERETRQKIANQARLLGGDAAYKDICAIYDKYDRAMKNCTNESERKHIAHCGAVELHKYFHCRGELVMDGELVIPAEKGYVQEEGKGKISKI